MGKGKTRAPEDKIVDLLNLRRKFYDGNYYTARLGKTWRGSEGILRKTEDCSLPGVMPSRRYLSKFDDYKF